MIKPIYLYGRPELRKRCDPIGIITKEMEDTLLDLKDTAYLGLGLSAPQIGKSLPLIVVNNTKGQSIAFINPKVLWYSDEVEEKEEGCLSLPGVFIRVTRAKAIRISYRDHNFILREEDFSGMFARILQHEIDHLKGILMTDYIGVIDRPKINKKLRRIKKGKIKPEYEYVGAK